MSKIILDDIASGYNLSKINENFQKIEDELNDKVLYRENPVGEPNQMSQNHDMNSHKLLNLKDGEVDSDAINLGQAKAILTVGGSADKFNHNDTLNKNAAGAHDAIYRRETDVAEIESGAFAINSLLTLRDRHFGNFKVVNIAPLMPNGWDTIEAGGGNVAIYDEPENFANVMHLGAKGDLLADDHGPIQAAINLKTNVYFPKNYNFLVGSTLQAAFFGQCLYSEGGLYSGATLHYAGSGKLIEFLASTNYPKLKNIGLRGKPTTPTDYYNTGSIAVDITAGAVSLNVEDCFIKGFEKIANSNFNSFYNSFSGCRFEEFRYGLFNFSANGLTFSASRAVKFNTFATINGNNGPTNIDDNFFEVFNGPIIQSTGVEFPSVSFTNNYIEDYYETDLPTNFPASAAPNTTKFGGNILFTGAGYGKLNIQDNDMQIASIFRIVSATNIKHFISKGNQLAFAQAGNNLDRLYSFGSTLTEYVEIADIKTSTGTADAGFTRAYTQIALDTKDVNRFHSFYDCFTGTIRKRTTNLVALTTLNGWTANDAVNGSIRAFKTVDGSTLLAGIVDGSAKTSEVVFNVPASHRPYEYGTTRAYSNFSVFSALGAGTIIRCRYLYASGDIRMELGAASYVSIPLDGIIIPPRH